MAENRFCSESAALLVFFDLLCCFGVHENATKTLNIEVVSQITTESNKLSRSLRNKKRSGFLCCIRDYLSSLNQKDYPARTRTVTRKKNRTACTFQLYRKKLCRKKLFVKT